MEQQCGFDGRAAEGVEGFVSCAGGSKKTRKAVVRRESADTLEYEVFHIGR